MLQSQRNQTRLCSKFLPENKRRPFDSYNEDELRKKMIALDGCNKKHPPTIHPKEQFQNSPGRPRHPFHVIMEYLSDGEYRTQAEIRKATNLSKQVVSNVMCKRVPSGEIAKLKSGNVTKYAHAKGAQKRKEQIFAEIADCLTGKNETPSRDVAFQLSMTTGQVAVYLGQMQELGMVTRKRIRQGKVSLWARA